MGIIDAIISILKRGSAKTPFTKKEITAELGKLFPDRETDKMAATVSVQVPYYIRKRGVEVEKVGSGFYVPKGKKAAAEAEEAAPVKSKGKKAKAAEAEAEEAPAKTKTKKNKSK